MAGWSQFGINTAKAGYATGGGGGGWGFAKPNIPAFNSPFSRPTSGGGFPSWGQGTGAGNPGLYNAPAHAMQQAPAAPAPPPQEDPAARYDAQFRAAMNAQRAQIDAQLRSAMTDINARRQQGAQIVAMQPSEVNAIYAASNPAIDKSVAAAKTDLKTAGASAPTAAQNAGLDAIKAGIEAAHASALADKPYLEIGANDLFNRQAGTAGALAQDARNNIAGQEAQYAAQRSVAETSNKSNLADQIALQNNQFQNQLKMAMLQSGSKQQQAQSEAQTLMASQPVGTAKWWQAYSAYNPEGASRLQSGFDPHKGSVDRWKKDPNLWNSAKAYLSPTMRAFLAAQYGLK